MKLYTLSAIIRLALVTLALLILLGAAGCYSPPRVVTEGHILDRFERNGRYVVRVIGPFGDTMEVATTREIFANYPPIYWKPEAWRDTIVRRLKCTTPPQLRPSEP